MSSIELAIKNEQSEMEFYLAEAERTFNPVAKLLFQTLAHDEHEHMTRIRILHEKLVAAGTWPVQVAIDVKGTVIERGLAEITRVSSATDIHEAQDITALKTAAEVEGRGIEFYAELARTSENPQEREFFERLSSIEREHLRSIEDTIFYLEDPHGWLSDHTRKVLDRD